MLSPGVRRWFCAVLAEPSCTTRSAANVPRRVFLGIWLRWRRGVSSTALHVDIPHRHLQLDAEQVRGKGRATNARRYVGRRYRHHAASSVHQDVQSCLGILLARQNTDLVLSFVTSLY